MTERKIWLLKLVLPGRWGKLATGILLLYQGENIAWRVGCPGWGGYPPATWVISPRAGWFPLRMAAREGAQMGQAA